ncbi:hypothetical protein FB565_003303 [Actinoplanes lutulentus]|uniref:Uncharacterized protein n=1 Tax=Actinoplanes lutulentus TaxID=1287878 RepID=A0A327YZZ9_9ACTN|nr:hypothetical protein [Actinoplanes lutulentus]MBB2943574.1 hypothetical protein [Actinoplanes lutulentus]RAK27440.1 hypothetical protein B0I29_12374 [Actinoplanes lutulentus]
MSGDGWERVASGRTRDEMIREFEAWVERVGFTPPDEDIRLNRGRHADGGDYWEIIYIRPR